MIFVDTNVFIYAVGKPHPLRSEAQEFFINSSKAGQRLVTSAEVLQELLHVYLPVRRIETLDAALELATKGVHEIIPITQDDVTHARVLVDRYPHLTARDLLHLAVCQRNGIKQIKTFDRGLQAVF
ncbi:MAG: type II toxin-antitoxin system VapC family toxin [Deltaproteobacteria bacterium]|mgnify:CR=1 FL=1|nr:type II toxin-antitoxin system VapC family toxin [Deltaproteobacteria bacterium]MBW1929365.1 type II toxin-antitoxin system VapC family toxin [Deltaproteobacteria bacterium]MBW2026046.1 type II toxin-antitoxin system VapC family toxin [Deltaproteobacteria bacterium]MBW2126766.1 type II toxin-antitoxin system VapC family toxin [Deltaproteobacteria bacterium]RLB21804.1 MAG: VapC toxin family PIN domain ribonuclease [Deltaproteobacteria bacterium]